MKSDPTFDKSFLAATNKINLGSPYCVWWLLLTQNFVEIIFKFLNRCGWKADFIFGNLFCYKYKLKGRQKKKKKIPKIWFLKTWQEFKSFVLMVGLISAFLYYTIGKASWTRAAVRDKLWRLGQTIHIAGRSSDARERSEICA